MGMQSHSGAFTPAQQLYFSGADCVPGEMCDIYVDSGRGLLSEHDRLVLIRKNKLCGLHDVSDIVRNIYDSEQVRLVPTLSEMIHAQHCG